MAFAGVGVCVLFVPGLDEPDPQVAHVFDCLHWTLAYVAAAIVAWLGVLDASGVDRVDAALVRDRPDASPLPAISSTTTTSSPAASCCRR